MRIRIKYIRIKYIRITYIRSITHIYVVSHPMSICSDEAIISFLRRERMSLGYSSIAVERHLKNDATSLDDVYAFRVAIMEDVGEVWRVDSELKTKGDVIGFACLVKVSESMFELKRVAVSEKFRRRGIGRNLVLSLLEEEVDLKTQQVVLETLETMGAAIAMYESLGFKHTRTFTCKDGTIVRSYSIGNASKAKDGTIVRSYSIGNASKDGTIVRSYSIGNASKASKKARTCGREKETQKHVLSTNALIRLESIDSKRQHVDVVVEVSRKKEDTIVRMAKRSDPYRRLVCDQNGRARFGNVKGMKNAEYNVVNVNSKEDDLVVELLSVGHRKKKWRLSWNSNSSLTSQFSTCDHSSSSTKFRIRVLSRNVFSHDDRFEDQDKRKRMTTTSTIKDTNLYDEGYVVFQSVVPSVITEQALYTINHALGTNQVISGGVQQDPYIKLHTKFSTHPSLLKLYPDRVVREFVDDPEPPTSCQIALRFPETEPCCT